MHTMWAWLIVSLTIWNLKNKALYIYLQPSPWSGHCFKTIYLIPSSEGSTDAYNVSLTNCEFDYLTNCEFDYLKLEKQGTLHLLQPFPWTRHCFKTIYLIPSSEGSTDAYNGSITNCEFDYLTNCEFDYLKLEKQGTLHLLQPFPWTRHCFKTIYLIPSSEGSTDAYNVSLTNCEFDYLTNCEFDYLKLEKQGTLHLLQPFPWTRHCFKTIYLIPSSEGSTDAYNVSLTNCEFDYLTNCEFDYLKLEKQGTLHLLQPFPWTRHCFKTIYLIPSIEGSTDAYNVSLANCEFDYLTNCEFDYLKLEKQGTLHLLQPFPWTRHCFKTIYLIPSSEGSTDAYNVSLTNCEFDYLTNCEFDKFD